MPTIEHTPHYIPQAEALLGTTAFYDAQRENKLHDGKLTFTAETAGMRGILYVRALRLLAQAVHERDVEESRAASLRPSRIGRFALEHLPEIIEISRELAVINTAERTIAEQENSFFGGLRPHQHPYLHDVIDFMNLPPSPVQVRDENGIRTEYIRGATVEAPTGTGKTVLMARTVVGLGVGQPIENIEHTRERVRALVIVPTQTLVEQMTGKVGDDTFRKFAPGLTVGGFYQYEKDDEADVVVTTIDQFINSFKHGTLNGQRFDILIIDEAHNATQPLLQKAILEHWHGGPVIGFTATPDYYEGKDVRELLRHRIFHGDILDFIQDENDILNAAQLYEIRVTYDAYLKNKLLEEFENMTRGQIDQLVLREATAEFLMPLVAQGRRGILFCEQGGGEPSGYAKKMAERLRELDRPDGTPLRVAVAGSLNAGKPRNDPNSNTGIRRRYAAGELDYIVTVDWGREGLNEDIDVVATIGKVSSRLKFLQEIGRGTRLSKNFPVTVYGHLFTPAFDRKAQSLFSLFGFEEIEQGIIIGKRIPDGEIANMEENVHIDLRGQPNPKLSSRSRIPPAIGIPLSAFPDRIRELIASVHAQTVGEALFHTSSNIVIPRDYRPFEHMLRDVPGPPATIRKYLRDEMGFASIGRFEPNENGRPFVFYFESAADAYLHTYRNAVARITLQREFGGVDVSIVNAIADECDAKQIMWFFSDGKWIPHYTRHDAERIRDKFAETETALPTDYSRGRICEETGLSRAALLNRLLPSEIALIVRKRTVTANGKIRVLDHWSQKDGEAIVTRIKEQNEAMGAPAHLVPYDLAARYVSIDKIRLIQFADYHGEPAEIVRTARTGRPPRCVTWSVMRAAAQQYGVRPTATFAINYSQLPNGPDDKDPAKAHYAKEVVAQLRMLPAKFTGK